MCVKRILCNFLKNSTTLLVIYTFKFRLKINFFKMFDTFSDFEILDGEQRQFDKQRARIGLPTTLKCPKLSYRHKLLYILSNLASKVSALERSVDFFLSSNYHCPFGKKNYFYARGTMFYLQEKTV